MDAVALAAICNVVGLLFVVVEVFLIPGFGFAGILGGALILVGAGLVWSEAGPLAGVAVLAGAGVASGAIVWIFLRSRASRGFILEQRLDDEQRLRAQAAGLVGTAGVAATDLRPAGGADLAGERYDVVTQGEFIDRGTAVRVVEVEGFRVVVEAVEAETGQD